MSAVASAFRRVRCADQAPGSAEDGPHSGPYKLPRPDITFLRASRLLGSSSTTLKFTTQQMQPNNQAFNCPLGNVQSRREEGKIHDVFNFANLLESGTAWA